MPVQGAHQCLHWGQGEGPGLCGCALMHKDAEQILTLFLARQGLVGIYLKSFSFSEAFFLLGPFVEKFKRRLEIPYTGQIIKALMRRLTRPGQ